MTGFDKCDITDLLHEKMCRPCSKINDCHGEDEEFNENQMYLCLNQKNISNEPSGLCDWCRCEMVGNAVRSKSTGDDEFCTLSCLIEAISQQGEVSIIGDDPDTGNEILECPHCHKKGPSVTDRWGSEGPFEIEGVEFSIMTCPYCGGVAPLIEE